MKNQLFVLIAFALLVLAACQPPAAIEEVEEIDYAAYDNNVEVLRSFIKAHSEENLEAQADLLSDTLKWSPPFYNGNTMLGKADYLAALKNYHDGFENISYEEGITLSNRKINGMWSGSVFPKEDATTVPGTIRLYGTWTATHTETGKNIGVKWFALGSVSDEGKIVSINEYFDVNGIAAQIAAE